jgi:hypothetical protein
VTTEANPLLHPTRVDERLQAAQKIARVLQDACGCTDPDCDLRRAALFVRQLALVNYELERAMACLPNAEAMYAGPPGLYVAGDTLHPGYLVPVYVEGGIAYPMHVEKENPLRRDGWNPTATFRGPIPPVA